MIGALVVLLVAIAAPSFAAQVCTDAQEFQSFALAHKAKSAEIDNQTKQIKLYMSNMANYKEQKQSAQERDRVATGECD